MVHELENNMETHPCFTNGCSKYARIHLPVAPKCNLQCNYCLRRFSCVNESRPGVTSQIMNPMEAVSWYLKMRAVHHNLTVVGIAGPGDALANWEQVRDTLQAIRSIDKKILFCLSTNGLMLPTYVEELLALQIGYVTVTVNAVNVATGAKIYQHLWWQGKKYTGEAAAELLLTQ